VGVIYEVGGWVVGSSVGLIPLVNGAV